MNASSLVIQLHEPRSMTKCRSCSAQALAGSVDWNKECRSRCVKLDKDGACECGGEITSCNNVAKSKR